MGRVHFESFQDRRGRRSRKHKSNWSGQSKWIGRRARRPRNDHVTEGQPVGEQTVARPTCAFACAALGPRVHLAVFPPFLFPFSLPTPTIALHELQPHPSTYHSNQPRWSSVRAAPKHPSFATASKPSLKNSSTKSTTSPSPPPPPPSTTSSLTTQKPPMAIGAQPRAGRIPPAPAPSKPPSRTSSTSTPNLAPNSQPPISAKPRSS